MGSVSVAPSQNSSHQPLLSLPISLLHSLSKHRRPAPVGFLASHQMLSPTPCLYRLNLWGGAVLSSLCTLPCGRWEWGSGGVCGGPDALVPTHRHHDSHEDSALLSRADLHSAPHPTRPAAGRGHPAGSRCPAVPTEDLRRHL